MHDDDGAPDNNGALNSIAGHAAVSGARRHCAGVRIGEGELPVRGIGQGFACRLQSHYCLPDAAVAAGQEHGGLPPCRHAQAGDFRTAR